MPTRILIGDPNNDFDERLGKFWTCINAWLKDSQNVEKYIGSMYQCHRGESCQLNIDFENAYNQYFGESKPFIYGKVSLQDIEHFVEILLARWVVDEQRQQVSREIDSMFERFDLPYVILNGHIVEKRLAELPTEDPDEIIDMDMFEGKIKAAETMILQGNIDSKKAALYYMVSAFQYFVSIQDGVGETEKRAKTALLVTQDQNSKIYAVVKEEIKTVFKMANEYFDIRHNDATNHAHEPREPLTDSTMIEYLYRRIHSLLDLLRIKYETVQTNGGTDG